MTLTPQLWQKAAALAAAAAFLSAASLAAGAAADPAASVSVDNEGNIHLNSSSLGNASVLINDVHVLQVLQDLQQQFLRLNSTVVPSVPAHAPLVFAMGGEVGVGVSGQLNAQGLRTVEAFNGTHWYPAASMVAIRSGFKAAVFPIDGIREYIVTAQGNLAAHPHNDGGLDERFDGKEWSPAHRMNSKLRTEGLAIRLEDGTKRLYAVDGYSKSVERLSDDGWKPVQDMRSVRHGLGFVSYSMAGEEYIFALGGYESPNIHKATTELFNGAEWRPAPSMLAKRMYFGAATFSVRGESYLFVAGGWDGTQHLKAVEKFNGTWTPAPSMRTPRADHQLVAYAIDGIEYLLAIGGWNKDTGYLDTVEKFDGVSWTPAPTMTTARRYFAAAVL